MRSRYTHGVVKVPYCAVEIYSWCSQGALIVRSRYTHGVVKVPYCAVEIYSWCV